MGRKQLKRELRGLPKGDPRAVEIRKLLGISTLSDLLGEAMPIRVCTYCGKRAYTVNDLWEFKYNKDAKYNHNNCCTDCLSLINYYKNPDVICGLHQPLVIYKGKKCQTCDNTNTIRHTGDRNWFTHRAVICKECLGTHENILGYPVYLKHSQRVIHWDGKEFDSIASLARYMELPYLEVRLMVIQNKLKDYNG